MASRWSLVLALAELGEFAEGIVYGQEAVRLAEQSGHLTTLLHATAPQRTWRLFSDTIRHIRASP